MRETNTATAFWIREPGRGALESEPIGGLQPGEVVVRALYSGISRGTEALVFRGEVPSSQREAMRCPFQEGAFPGPLKYGYASVGRVVEAAEAPREAADARPSSSDPHLPRDPEPAELVDRLVFCLHPHQDLYRVPARAVVPLPDGLPPERAVLAAYMETAINASWDGRPGVGDHVVVIGAGVLGLLVAVLCRRIPGMRVLVVDSNRARGEVAHALGLRFATPPELEAGPAGPGADLVFHASGSAGGLRTALRLAGEEGRILELSWYGTRTVEMPLGEEFHSRRLELKGSQVSRVPPDRRPRWTTRRRMTLSLELLLDPSFDVLVSGESPFEELPTVMDRLSREPGNTLCHRIRYPAAGETRPEQNQESTPHVQSHRS